MRNRALVLVLLLASWSGADGQPPATTMPATAPKWGNCSGNIDARWLEDGRKMMLLADYVYTDPVSRPWLAPKGAEIDGASIPQGLWTFIGGPFEGLYRKASVVHDVGCDEKKAEWRAVHKMFYDAMRCSNVTERRAKIMYWAVYHCGPRWGRDKGVKVCPPAGVADDIRRLKEYLRKRVGVELAELEKLTRDDLSEVEVNLRAFVEAIERLKRIAPVYKRADGATVVRLLDGWLYEPKKGRLTKRGATQIGDIRAVFADLPDTEFVVQPFVASMDDREALTLSKDRAVALADQLVAYGVNYTQIRLDKARVPERPDLSGMALVPEWQEVVIREGL